MLTLSVCKQFLLPEISSEALENSCSDSTDVEGIHLNLTASLERGSSSPWSRLVFQNPNGSAERGNRGKSLYSAIQMVLFASLLGPWPFLLALETVVA